jgi:spore coat polysaccharide biosynthesis predicted glycosyltransferase SpsG
MVKILFRTAGGSAKNKELGTGHIFRCVNLVDQLKNHKIFVIVEDYGGVKKILDQKKFNQINYLKPGLSVKEDLKKTIEIIKKNKIDLIIVDKIQIDKKYLQELKKIIFTVYISDLMKIDFPSHIVVNGFIGLPNKIQLNKYNSKCLVGSSYQILSKFNSKRNSLKKKYDLIVTFGGYDANNLIDRLCTILPNFLTKLKIIIILGPSTKKSSCISKLEKDFPKSLTVINFTNNLQKIIKQSKFGLCSGGITTYEFARLKTPFGIICQYQHQQFTAKEWEKKHYAINLGNPTKQLEKKIENFLLNLINNQFNFKMKKNLIDDLGSSRVANEILKSFKINCKKLN